MNTTMTAYLGKLSSGNKYFAIIPGFNKSCLYDTSIANLLERINIELSTLYNNLTEEERNAIPSFVGTYQVQISLIDQTTNDETSFDQENDTSESESSDVTEFETNDKSEVQLTTKTEQIAIVNFDNLGWRGQKKILNRYLKFLSLFYNTHFSIYFFTKENTSVFKRTVDEMLDILDDDEKSILRLHYGLDSGTRQNKQTICAMYRKTYSWINPRLDRAISRMKKEGVKKAILSAFPAEYKDILVSS